MRSAALITLLGWSVVGLAAPEASDDLSQARQLYESRHYAEARVCFTRLAAARPDDPELDFYLGRLALWFDDADDALSCLERAARNAPRDARIQNALGDAYGLMAQNAGILAKLGWARRCLASYERAVQSAQIIADSDRSKRLEHI